ncbi:hypothetical protein FJU30_06495 [Affinibrenneria salicis]|uniref:Death domain-containing protein n=1 Tax=Affinibrenneria salicis TaxID=2590031 RepID=A0A5J5G4Y3_9GAMM|nr:hypothetical protein [Affinibrenneria salicis]KAA9001924.1 hypothetical protein FJU30_06495 [Affinibrenneria salicis]
MDIWQWYRQYQQDMWESGQNYPVRLVDDFIDSVVDIQYGKTEALLPELRALKKTANNPWLEVLIGHWEMRHRLNNAREGQTALSDVVALYERAHRSDAAECPQSICVTQDLSHCYANLDAPGWADERIAVCQETMDKIDPLWSCYQCLSEEQFLAMIDKGDYAQALDFVRRQIANIQAAGEDDVDGLREDEAIGLMMLQQYDEALAVINAVIDNSDPNDSAQTRETQAMIKLLILATMGQDEEAWRLLPPPAAVTPHISMRWTAVVGLLLARAPEKNSWQIGRVLQQVLEQRERVGAHRDVITVAKVHIRLALGRQAIWVARRALAIAQTHLAELRSPLGDDRALAALADEISVHALQTSLPVPADQLMSWLEQRADEERDPEQEVEWLTLAVSERPDDQPLQLLAASALQACAAERQAAELLEAWVQRHPEEESEIVYQLLQLLLRAGNFSRIEQLAEHYQAGMPHVALWYRIQAAQAQEDWEKTERLCMQMTQLAGMENKISPWMIAGVAAMKLKGFDRALACYQQALIRIDAQEMSPVNALWDAMTAASALQDWPTVRALSARLEMTFSSDEGPIEENWGWVRLRFWEDHEYRYYLALRTGPVTAIVRQPGYNNAVQHFNDLVVFDAALLNEQPETEEEKEHFIGLYDVVHVVKSGQYAPAWFIDGVAPGQEAFQQLADQLEAERCYVWVTSDDDYQVVDSQAGDTPLPGLHFVLSAPLDMPEQNIDSLLSRLTAGWQHQPHWLALARKAGLDESRHLATIERYQL